MQGARKGISNEEMRSAPPQLHSSSSAAIHNCCGRRRKSEAHEAAGSAQGTAAGQVEGYSSRTLASCSHDA